MVLFDNICVNQRVEVKGRRNIFPGLVKFKGCLNGIPGDWVGVQLDKNVDGNDGMIKARRYFSCPAGHGVFVPAEKIRFCTKKRCLYNSYRSVERDPDVFTEQELFGLERPVSSGVPAVSKSHADIYKSETDYFKRPASHHLRHSVGNQIPAATMLRPTSARAPFSYRSTPIHTEYPPDLSEWENYREPAWISSPSIPHTHMPRSAMKQQLRCGWETPHQHYPRYWPVHTGRETVKWDKWNDVSY